ncbi:Uu.00g132160.m01.CDS01 [Anthostomella pinea]|uniref:Uu.00g132160.m01.CDS01 n=1 Tax=Anthostomella pinea TaxID=933095 RepID=A0AAI8YIG5_9PEZI|nr:Uu.00g132160.m01.CDS01 [Anthostomella pinea]
MLTIVLPVLASALRVAAGLVVQRDPGDPDFYNTVAEIYSGPDCAVDSFVWADPIFGRGGVCQPLDRNNNTPDILSYRPTAIYPDCTVTLYTDSECQSTPYTAVVGECVQAGVPLVSAFVQCPFSDKL